VIPSGQLPSASGLPARAQADSGPIPVQPLQPRAAQSAHAQDVAGPSESQGFTGVPVPAGSPRAAAAHFEADPAPASTHGFLIATPPTTPRAISLKTDALTESIEFEAGSAPASTHAFQIATPPTTPRGMKEHRQAEVNVASAARVFAATAVQQFKERMNSEPTKTQLQELLEIENKGDHLVTMVGFSIEHACCAIALDVLYSTVPPEISPPEFDIFLDLFLRGARDVIDTMHPHARFLDAREALSSFAFSLPQLNRLAEEVQSMEGSPYAGMSSEKLGWLFFEPVLRQNLVKHFHLCERNPYLPFVLNTHHERYAERMLDAMSEVATQVKSRKRIDAKQLTDIHRLITAKTGLGLEEAMFAVQMGRGLSPDGYEQAKATVERLNQIYRSVVKAKSGMRNNPNFERYGLNSWHRGGTVRRQQVNLIRLQADPDTNLAREIDEEMINIILSDYYQKRDAADSAPHPVRARWEAIVSVVQEMELIHAFPDGNSRLSMILLLQRLAAELQADGKIDIPPGCVPMFKDTWIDMLSRKEALELLEFRSGQVGVPVLATLS
jgi:hypothetical protein